MAEGESEDGSSFDLSQLRNLVRDYVDNHLYSSALFWADKICSLSDNNEQDVLWFAHILFLTKQYLRAAHILISNGLTSTNAVARYLAAKCYFECKDWRNALEVLENETKELKIDRKESDCIKGNLSFDVSHLASPPIKGNRKIECAIAVLKGMIYEALENRNVAIQCFKDALHHDVFCYEAFEMLVSHHALSSSEEIDLINSLPYSQQCNEEETRLVRFAYENMVNKYGKHIETSLPPALKKLNSNLDHIICKAERCFNCCNYRDAYRYTTTVIKKDPLHETCLPVHISCLVELKKEIDLFNLAQRLVNTYPTRAISWYAVGAYYLLIKKNEQARKFFSKATTVDKNFGPAWLGFAHSYASEGERDQAISAYYSAAKLMPGSHLPFLYLGLEYSLSNNLKLATNFYKDALLIGSKDPHIRHELGSLAYQNGDYAQAETYFLTALKQVQETTDYKSSDIWEPLYNNLGQTARKLEKYDNAIAYHEKSLLYKPKNPGAFSALGLCYLFKGNDERAIMMFHRALSIRKDDTITIQLLGIALENLSNSGDPAANLSLDKTSLTEIGGENLSEGGSNSNSLIELSCDSGSSTWNDTNGKDESELSTVEMKDSSCMSIEDF